MSNPPLFVGFGGMGDYLRQDFTKWFSQIQIPDIPHGLAQLPGCTTIPSSKIPLNV